MCYCIQCYVICIFQFTFGCILLPNLDSYFKVAHCLPFGYKGPSVSIESLIGFVN